MKNIKTLCTKSTNFYMTKMTYQYLYGPSFNYTKTIQYLKSKKSKPSPKSTKIK